MSYFAFVRANRRFLAFGFLLAAVSSYGQTFLVSLFGAEWREVFALSNGEFGLVYSVATLFSGISLIWLGRLVDSVDLRVFTAAILGGAAAGALLLAGAVNVLTLGVAFLLLRVCGQGLLMHTAQTTMGRYFDADRGKAVSIATLGLSAAEAVMPAVLVALMALVGWRGTWLALAAVLLLVVLPVALHLLRGHDRRRHRLARDEARHAEASGVAPGAGWRRRDVLTDGVFYGVVPALVGPPFIMTALFFHQVPLANEKGWSLPWLASSFVAFAAAHVLSLALAGPLVDRVGATRLLGGFLLPMSAGLAVLLTVDAAWGAPLYLGLAGLSVGVTGTLMGALWPELYGTDHLGAIRALVHALMVLVSAAAPAAVGLVMDAGVSIVSVAGWLVAWTLGASLLAGIVVHRRVPAAGGPRPSPAMR